MIDLLYKFLLTERPSFPPSNRLGNNFHFLKLTSDKSLLAFGINSGCIKKNKFHGLNHAVHHLLISTSLSFLAVSLIFSALKISSTFSLVLLIVFSKIICQSGRAESFSML